MKSAIPVVFAMFFGGLAQAADLSPSSDVTLEGTGPYSAFDLDLKDFMWEKRPIVVFADADADPRYREQMELLTARLDALAERDVIVLTDTDPEAEAAIRTQLRPRGFMLVLIGKDGGVKLRKPAPWDVRELSRVIDKMPMRQQELRDKRARGD
ncbi:MAG: DUF4174 domain-containing protein [Pseudomonadota bacterium]